MGQLTYTQLNNILYKLLDIKPNYPVIYNDALSNYYNIGIRPNELMNMDLWSYIDDSRIILSPLKSNNTRIFIKSELSDILYKSVVSNTNQYAPINTERLKHYVKKFISIYPLYVGKKQQEINLFRHRYIKSLKIDGYSDIDISNKMGYTHPNTVYSYLNSEITY